MISHTDVFESRRDESDYLDIIPPRLVFSLFVSLLLKTNQETNKPTKTCDVSSAQRETERKLES